MLNVLLKSETVVLEVSELMSPNLVDEYYVCPAVMIELMKENKYVMDGDDTVPASYRDIKEARRKVKAFEWNSHLKKFDVISILAYESCFTRVSDARSVTRFYKTS